MLLFICENEYVMFPKQGDKNKQEWKTALSNWLCLETGIWIWYSGVAYYKHAVAVWKPSCIPTAVLKEVKD